MLDENLEQYSKQGRPEERPFARPIRLSKLTVHPHPRDRGTPSWRQHLAPPEAGS